MTMSLDIEGYIRGIAERAKKAARVVSGLDSKPKDAALLKMAEYLDADAEELMVENQKDLITGREKGLSTALLDRLRLTPAQKAHPHLFHADSEANVVEPSANGCPSSREGS